MVAQDGHLIFMNVTSQKTYRDAGERTLRTIIVDPGQSGEPSDHRETIDSSLTKANQTFNTIRSAIGPSAWLNRSHARR